MKAEEVLNKLEKIVPDWSISGNNKKSAIEASNEVREKKLKILEQYAREVAVEFLNYMSNIQEMDDKTGKSLEKENERLFDEWINQ